MKTALTVTALVILALGGTCGGLYVWLQQHKDELTARGKTAMQDGAHFGSGRDAGACLDEAARRLATATGVMPEALNKVWLEACFKVASVPAGFCDGVPPRGEIMRSATWALGRCTALGHDGDAACARLVGAVQERCLAPP